MATVEQPKKGSWNELAVVAVAAAILFAFVPMEKIIAGLTVALGLGFVIFWHELGHFLVAKWCGVKVLKFAIGFGPPIVSYRKGMGFSLFSSRNKEYDDLIKSAAEGTTSRDVSALGETEYALAALPLGGFVRMLGEEPGEEEAKSVDPRAFHNKSVGARMAILLAGVTMNLILGIAILMVIFMRGTIEMPAVVGDVIAGSPAFRAGIRPGDEILSIDGRRDITYNDMRRMVALSGRGQELRFELKRSGVSEPVVLGIHPLRSPGDPMPSIGVLLGESLELAEKPFLTPPGMAGEPKGTQGGFQKGDTIIAVGLGDKTEPVETAQDLDRILARYADQPLTFVVRRANPAEGSKASSQSAITVPPNHFVTIGARMTIGPVSAIRKGSVAERAGFQVGDRILRVDGEEIDPLRIPTYVHDHADRDVDFEVSRQGSDDKPQILSLSARPDSAPILTGYFFPKDSISVNGLGLSYPVLPEVASVAEGSPASKAGLKAGDRIASVKFTLPAEGTGGKPKTIEVDLESKNSSWVTIFSDFQVLPKGAKVELTRRGSKSPIPVTPEPDPTWFCPQRGLQLLNLTRPLPPQSLSTAFRRSAQEATDMAFGVYALIRGLFQKRLPGDSVGGIIGITGMAYSAARSGFDELVRFLAMLSINLAVLNLLPIPPLDGGQLVFLVAEKIRGRPLPDSALTAITIAGIVFVLLLFVFVTFNDIMRFFR